MVSLEEDNLEAKIRGSQILTYSSSLLTEQVIRYRKGQRWSEIDLFLIEQYGIQYKKEISMLTSLIASARRYGLKGAYISLHKENYTAANKLTGQGVSYTKTRKLLSLLDSDGYITLYVGYYDTKNEVGVKSFFICEEKMNDLWEGVDTSTAMKREEDTIVVRDSKTKENLPTRQFRGIALLREDLQKYNSLLSRHSVSIDSQEVNISYKRVFHDCLQSSGRYYSNSSFQTIGKEHRANIIIDDCETVELDYSAMHPRLLYTLDGISLPQSFYPYYVEGVEKSVSKICGLMLLYNDNKRNAINAARQHFERNGIAVENISEIISTLIENNKRISKHFFHRDMWKGLQFLDSSIATEVLQMCISRNIVALPYHDSFRVKREDKEILKGIMFEGWKRVMKTTNNCVVEEK